MKSSGLVDTFLMVKNLFCQQLKVFLLVRFFFTSTDLSGEHESTYILAWLHQAIHKITVGQMCTLFQCREGNKPGPDI